MSTLIVSTTSRDTVPPAGVAAAAGLLKAIATGLVDGLRTQRRYDALRARGVPHAEAARIAFDGA